MGLEFCLFPLVRDSCYEDLAWGSLSFLNIGFFLLSTTGVLAEMEMNWVASMICIMLVSRSKYTSWSWLGSYSVQKC